MSTHPILDNRGAAREPVCGGRDACLTPADGMLVALRELAAEKNLRRISIRTAGGGHLLEVPLTLGLTPHPAVWMALERLVGELDQCKVVVEREAGWPPQAQLLHVCGAVAESTAQDGQ